MTCQYLRSSAISVAIWFLAISSFTRSRHLSFGLSRFRFPSTVIYNIVLVTSSRLCTCPNHLNLFALRNSAIGYMCASFQMSTFLTLFILVFPPAHRSLRISVVCNFLSSFLIAQHSAPYVMTGYIAVLYTLSFNLLLCSCRTSRQQFPSTLTRQSLLCYLHLSRLLRWHRSMSPDT